jgi:hypothetical protein
VERILGPGDPQLNYSDHLAAQVDYQPDYQKYPYAQHRLVYDSPLPRPVAAGNTANIPNSKNTYFIQNIQIF